MPQAQINLQPEIQAQAQTDSPQPYSLKKRLLAAAGILAITAVWGSSFVFVKNAISIITPLWFLALRFTLAGLLLMLWQARNLSQLGKKGLKASVLAGMPLAMGYGLQTIGLMHTAASNAAMLTGIYIIFIPLLQWLYIRRLGKGQILVSLLAFIGLCAFSLDGEARMQSGDIWVVFSAVSYAIHFLVLDKYAKIYPVNLLAAAQISVAALLLTLAALVLEPLPTAASFNPELLQTLVFTAVLATALAYMVQTAAQRVLPPATAAMLFTSESLFGAISGMLLLQESFSLRQLLGGLVMFACIVFSVLGEGVTDRFLRRLKGSGSYGRIASGEAPKE